MYCILYSFSHPATIFNKLELSWVELSPVDVSALIGADAYWSRKSYFQVGNSDSASTPTSDSEIRVGKYEFPSPVERRISHEANVVFFIWCLFFWFTEWKTLKTWTEHSTSPRFVDRIQNESILIDASESMMLTCSLQGSTPLYTACVSKKRLQIPPISGKDTHKSMVSHFFGSRCRSLN